MARRGRRSKFEARHHGPTRTRHVALEGVLRVARPGSASVVTEEGTFLVAKGGLREGMNGDVVRVTLAHHGPGEPQAQVQTVVSRAHRSFVGTFGVAGPLGAVVPLDERIRRDFFVLPDDASAERLGVREGDVVVARILTYPSRREAGVVTVARRLGSPDGLDIPIERIIASYDLPAHFGPEALAQAEGIHADVVATLAAERKRKDLRDIVCVTVDPTTARDFDDAVSCERTAAGGWLLGVHIADVTHYVRWDSPIDIEARERTCSAYLVDRVLPMLPERLCNDVCSLVPGQDRLAMSVLVELDAHGEVLSSRAYASAIRSRARLDYGTVDAVLAGEAGTDALACEEGVDPEAIARMLRDLARLGELRREVRRCRGAVDFESVEAKVLLDGAGRPTGVSVRKRTPATSLVEEAMLVVNEAVAAKLAGREDDLPAAFRVHEQPSPDSLGATIPALRELDLLRAGEAERLRAGDPFCIQDVLARADGTSGEYPANTMLLRAMKRAIYLPRNDGHYALGAKAYCHFTSPIRRYPDMCVHRALKALLGMGGDAGFDVRARSEAQRIMPQLCRGCSERERTADAAAKESQRIKMAELYEGRVGESFSGIVVGCERFGLFVRLDETCAEGMLPVRALGEEWFSYDEDTLSLTGEATGKRWRLGQRVAVVVAGCDPARGRIDFRLA